MPCIFSPAGQWPSRKKAHVECAWWRDCLRLTAFGWRASLGPQAGRTLRIARVTVQLDAGTPRNRFCMAYFLPTHSRTKFIIRIFIRQYTKRSFFKLSENGCTAPFHGTALIAIELRMGLWTERLQACLQSGCFLGQRALAAGLHIKNGIHHLPDAALAQMPSLAHRSKALSLHLLLISHVAWTHAEICCLSWFWERVSGPGGGRPHGGQ